MIVISGALVLVALVLLLIGIVSPELTFVYSSIIVSLVSLVFLIIGILQRRGEILPGDEAVQTDGPIEVAEGVTAVLPKGVRKPAATATLPVVEVPAAEVADEEELEYGGTVLVVTGRPRYHVEGCRYLTGKQVEPIDVLDALEEGFSPCGVCKPDAALEADDAAAAAEAQAEQVTEPVPVPARAAPAKTRAVPAELAHAPVKKSTLSKPATKGLPAAPAKGTKAAPAKVAPAKVAAAKVAPAKVAAAKVAPAKVAAAKVAPVKSVPARPAAAASGSTDGTRRAGSVVVIPERGRFHRADCHYLRGVDGAEVMNRAAAAKQGYSACGVCKP